MVKIRQAIVVEGKYDKNTLCQLVDAPIIQTDGFHIMKDKEQLALLRAVAQKRGLIVFTDSDGAGFVIRNYLKSAIASQYLLHAYIPDIPGKERRKSAPGKEGLLGVEGMTPEIILEALHRSGATFEDGQSEHTETITKVDLFCMGLSGNPASKAKRLALQKLLQFPAHMSTNALLQALNILYTKEQLLKIVDTL